MYNLIYKGYKAGEQKALILHQIRNDPITEPQLRVIAYTAFDLIKSNKLQRIEICIESIPEKPENPNLPKVEVIKN